jgi:hypothetical protein
MKWILVIMDTNIPISHIITHINHNNNNMGSTQSTTMRRSGAKKNAVVAVNNVTPLESVQQCRSNIAQLDSYVKQTASDPQQPQMAQFTILANKANAQLDREGKPFTKNDLIVVLIALGAIKLTDMEFVEKNMSVPELYTMIRGIIYDPTRVGIQIPYDQQQSTIQNNSQTYSQPPPQPQQNYSQTPQTQRLALPSTSQPQQRLALPSSQQQQPQQPQRLALPSSQQQQPQQPQQRLALPSSQQQQPQQPQRLALPSSLPSSQQYQLVRV